MKTKDFESWLRTSRQMAEDAIRSRVGNCIRVDKVYDLDKQYEVDHCQGLLVALSYSKEAERINAPVLHRIPIEGNLYDGTATLKAAVRRYVEFMESLAENSGKDPSSTNKNLES